MPMPVSDTVSSRRAVDRRATRTVTPPSNVNFNAFESRFMTILAHISRST